MMEGRASTSERYRSADEVFMEALNFFNIENPVFSSEEQLLQILIHASETISRMDNSLVSWTDSTGVSLLWYAAREGYSLITDFLLERGADPTTSKKIRGRRDESIKADATPLMAAIYSSNLKLAEQLLDHLETFDMYVSPELAGMGLLEVESNGRNISRDSYASRVVTNLISRAGHGINRPIKLMRGSDKVCSILCHAASDPDLVHLVRRLLQEEHVTGHGAALKMAARCGNLKMMEVLVKNSSQIAQEEYSQSLIYACEADPQNVYSTAELLLKSGASTTFRDSLDRSALSVAVRVGSKPLLELFLSHGGDPLDGFLNLEGIPVAEPIIECINVLFEQLRQTSTYWIDRRLNGKPIITMFAIQCPGYYVKMAINAGANIELRDNSFEAEYRTPLDWACRVNNVSAAHALLEANANLNELNVADGWTCFHTAVKHGSKELIELLLKYNVDSNVQMETEQHRGCTGLHLAVARGSKPIVDMLLCASDINVNLVRGNHCTALQDAVMNACIDKKEEISEIVAALLEHGASANIPDDGMNTPLIYAVESLDMNLVRLLVEKGADLEYENENGDSPLSIAAENLDSDNGKEIMSMMIRSQTDSIFRPELVKVLQEKVEALLSTERNLTVAALAWEMLNSFEARKLITDTPNLWRVHNRADHKTLNHCWSEEVESHSLYPENMLTWAIPRNDIAVKILLESEHNDIKLPPEWRSNLCIHHTVVGSPLRCAVDEENIQALTSIMGVLKPAWNFYYPIRSKQRNSEHPLDKLNHYDFLYIISAYPALMADFLKEAHLVPAYSWVSGIKRAPIGNHTIWVSLTKARSPLGIWKNYIKRNGQFKYLQKPWHKTDPIFSSTSCRESLNFGDCSSLQHNYDYEDSMEATDSEDTNVDQFALHRLYTKIRLKIDGKMRRILYGRNFSCDFDVDPSKGVRDMVPLISEISYIERDVEAYLVPVQHFASYDMLFSCVSASYKLNNPSLFDSRVMAAAVQLHWRLYGFRTHIFNLILYIGLLLAFLILVFIYQRFIELGGFAKICVYLLQTYKVVYSLYFIVLEFLQLRHDGNLWKYLKDPWNLLDLPAYFFLLTGVVLQSINPQSSFAAGFHGITSLLLWFKLLYFMRPFCSYGPMVYMIFQVIFDIKIFLSILLIVMIGFGNAFFIIMGGQNGGFSCNESTQIMQEICQDVSAPAPFDSMFRALRSSISYTLGNYELSDLDEGLFPVLLSIIWAIFMVIVAIILLNLLIAIISGSYGRVSANKIPAWRLEQARIIVNIYAGMSHRERKNLNNLMLEFPWLQVLAPQK